LQGDGQSREIRRRTGAQVDDDPLQRIDRGRVTRDPLVDARDGRHFYYDINALSNFVADSPRVVGFDAYERLADWLVAEAERAVGVDAPALAAGRA